MKLQDTLDAMKKKSIAGMRSEIIAPYLKETEKMVQSGIADEAIKVGETLPEFELPDEKGNLVSSKELLTKGPLAVSFYRGVW